MRKILITLVFTLFTFSMSNAQAQSESWVSPDKYAVSLNSFWSNWYVQVGLDMSLQNPYGHSFSHVFPNGKSFGVNAAAGRWFTPGLGLRAKVNWENGIKLFENGHLTWLAPFYQNGVNMHKGGYMSVVTDGEVFNLNLLFDIGGFRL